MRKRLFWLWFLPVLLCGLPLLSGIALIIAANTQTGRGFIVDGLHSVTGGHLRLSGLTGQLPGQLNVEHLSWQGEQGHVDISRLELAWNPWQLLSGVADIQQLQAAHITFTPSPTAWEFPELRPIHLPVAVRLEQLHIGQFDWVTADSPNPSVMLDGQMHLQELTQGDLQVSLRYLHLDGAYRLNGQFGNDGIHAKLSVQEPAQGLLATLAGWHESKPLSLTAEIDGPLANLQTQLELDWQPLTVRLQGTLNAITQQANWDITAKAPAMQPHTGLAWQQLGGHGKLQGALSKPTLEGVLDVTHLRIGQTLFGQLHLQAQGDGGQLQLGGKLDKLTPAGTTDDLLQAHPLSLQAGIRLDQARYPLILSLQHPLFSMTGTADTAIQPQGHFQIKLPDLQHLARLAGVDMAGNGTMDIQISQDTSRTNVALEGGLNLHGGQAAIIKLLGPQPKFGFNLDVGNTDISLVQAKLQGKAIAAQAKGGLKGPLARLDWQIQLNDLAAIMTTQTQGKLLAQGQINGPLDDFSATAEVTGDLGLNGLPRKAVTAKLNIGHLPHRGVGYLNANALLAGAPLQLAMTFKTETDDTLHLAINKADWQSLHSQGAFTLSPTHLWPVGALDITVQRLDDFRLFLKHPITGSLVASLKTTQPGTSQWLIAVHNAQLPDHIGIAQASLEATLSDLSNSPHLKGRLNLDGLDIGTVAGGGQIEFVGPLSQLALQMSARIDDLAGAAMDIKGGGVYLADSQKLEVSDFNANWQKQQLHLSAPMALTLGHEMQIQHLQMAWGDASLLIDGQLAPVLGLKAQLQRLNMDKLALAFPECPISGNVSAEAVFHGDIDEPSGTISLNADNLRLLGENSEALPPAKLIATANLQGGEASVQATIKAGNHADLEVSGTIPFTPQATLNLQGKGSVDLKLLDPLLTANGRRMRGQISLEGALVGTPAQPQVMGTVTLKDVEFRDYAIGANLTAINGQIKAKDSLLLIEQLHGMAGAGTITANGNIDVLKEGIPLNLAITANNAKPLASDSLTVELNADLTLKGLAAEQLQLLGNIQINRAEIRIPEHLPTNLAVLKLQTQGKTVSQAPSPVNSRLKLGLEVSAVEQVFVRGRGVDAELDGKVRVQGNASQPDVDGEFKLRRGQFSLGGKALNFSQGRINFDNGKADDPSLNFVVAKSKNSVTTTLTLTGTATKPKISLSSVPDLPQDEILARLLFDSDTINLSMLEMLQLGSAVATLTGSMLNIVDPLDTVRKTLGLDRLTVGGQTNTTSLDAGSYVVPGVYIGTRQGLAGTPQATLQIDLSKHIKLEAAMGANNNPGPSKNTNPNSFGIVYEFDY